MGGTPLPPFTDKIFSEKGVTDLRGYTPPFTDKTRKVVFEVAPYDLMSISILECPQYFQHSTQCPFIYSC